MITSFIVPKFSEIHQLIDEYKKKSSEESRFVYALDKIEPVLNIYLDKGRTWKEKDISLEMLIKNKKDKVVFSPVIKEYFDEIVDVLRKEEKELFGSDSLTN